MGDTTTLADTRQDEGRGDRFTPFIRQSDGGTANLELVVENIHCAGCIRRIEQGLLALDGVLAARVNFSTRRLAVAWDPARIHPDRLLQVLEAAGYRAVPHAGTPPDAREERQLLRALGVAGFAAANVMLLSVSVWSGLASDMGAATRLLFHWVSALIALPAVVYAGQPFFRSALRALSAWRLNMDVPISLAVVLASGLSLYRTMVGEELVYFDAALMLLFFLLIGRYLDLRVRSRARSVATNLLALRATAATVLDDAGRAHEVAVEALAPGMRVRVAAGQRVPADGTILEGRSEFDTALVTGESLPATGCPGDGVYAGTVNLGAAVDMEVTAGDQDSLLAEIVRLMEAAESRRGPFVRLADRAAAVYAPLVHLLALATFIGWLWLGTAGWEDALMKAVAVLIITCPCALGLAVPVVQVVAIGRLLRRGILVKAGDALERLAEVDHLVFDKTGTLTDGRLTLLAPERLPREALDFAAGMAAASRHPLARALAAAAGGVPAPPEVREVPGCGLILALPEGEARLGRRDWCDLPDDAATAPGPELWLTRPGEPPVQFRFADALRSDATAVLDGLRKRGLSLEILSGDRAAPVREAAEALGVEDWRAEARPDDKIARLEALAQEGRKVAMIGDGLNDAPALARAWVSLSPASAADISQTSADVVFQGDRLMPIAEAWQTARRARRLILQNFALAAIYNIATVPLAMAGLVTPLIAAVAMSASSILVTLNALRLGGKAR